MRKVLIAMTIATVTVIGGVSLIGVAAYAGTGTQGDPFTPGDKVDFCHYDGSETGGGSGKYNSPDASTTATGPAGHIGHAFDVIPSYWFQQNENSDPAFYGGVNWPTLTNLPSSPVDFTPLLGSSASAFIAGGCGEPVITTTTVAPCPNGTQTVTVTETKTVTVTEANSLNEEPAESCTVTTTTTITKTETTTTVTPRLLVKADASSSCDEQTGHVIISVVVENIGSVPANVTVTDQTFGGGSSGPVLIPVGGSHTFTLDAGLAPLPGGVVKVFADFGDGRDMTLFVEHSPTEACRSVTTTTTTTPVTTTTTSPPVVTTTTTTPPPVHVTTTTTATVPPPVSTSTAPPPPVGGGNPPPNNNPPNNNPPNQAPPNQGPPEQLAFTGPGENILPITIVAGLLLLFGVLFLMRAHGLRSDGGIQLPPPPE